MALISDSIKRPVGSLGAMLGACRARPQESGNDLNDKEKMLAILKAEEIRNSVAHSSVHSLGSQQVTFEVETNVDDEVKQTSGVCAITETSNDVEETLQYQHQKGNEEAMYVERVERLELLSTGLNTQPSEITLNEEYTTENINIAFSESSWPLSLSKIYGKKHRKRKGHKHYIESNDTSCCERDSATQTLQSQSSICARVESTHARNMECNMVIKPYDYSSAKTILGFEDSLASQGQKLVKGATILQHGKNTSNPKFRDHSSADTSFNPLHRIRNDLKAQNLRPGKRRQVFPQSGNRTGTFS